MKFVLKIPSQSSLFRLLFELHV